MSGLRGIAALLLTAVGCIGWSLAAAPAQVPTGFPQPLASAAATETASEILRAEIGRYLFYDVRLSGDGTYACASCHRQELAFTDGLPRAVGATGEFHARNTPTLTNVAYHTSLTWADPGLTALEEQAKVPLLQTHPVEMGVAGREDEVLERLRQDPWYAPRFARAFPGDIPVSLTSVTLALAAFERTILSGGSPYDRWLFHDERDALTPEARGGMALFFSERLGCGQCHSGFNLSGPVTFEGGPLALGLSLDESFHNNGRGGLFQAGKPPDPGLARVTGQAQDTGRFRAPTLRNIAVTAPYMHDGSLATLAEVIDHYETAGRGNALASPRLRLFRLTPTERRELIAFLESLTDEAFLRDPRLGNPF